MSFVVIFYHYNRQGASTWATWYDYGSEAVYRANYMPSDFAKPMVTGVTPELAAYFCTNLSAHRQFLGLIADSSDQYDTVNVGEFFRRYHQWQTSGVPQSILDQVDFLVHQIFAP